MFSISFNSKFLAHSSQPHYLQVSSTCESPPTSSLAHIQSLSHPSAMIPHIQNVATSQLPTSQFDWKTSSLALNNSIR